MMFKYEITATIHNNILKLIIKSNNSAYKNYKKKTIFELNRFRTTNYFVPLANIENYNYENSNVLLLMFLFFTEKLC